MLDMGFEPQIRRIVALCLQGAARQTLLFTATWPASVARAAAALTARGAAHVRIGDNGSKLVVNKSISQHVEVLANDSAKPARLEALLRDASALPPGERAIVFVATKRRCDQIALQLQRARFPVAGAIHGDKDQREREAALNAFRQGDKSILIATDVAARGLDIPGVAVVVIFDFPREVADYVHRVGRTGRAGASGAAYTFLTPNDAGVARQLKQLLSDAGAKVPPALEAMANTKQRGGGGGGGGNNRWRGGRGGGGGGRGGGRGRGKW
jgi:ATP-dependent RNA helicase DDX5/DBP2